MRHQTDGIAHTEGEKVERKVHDEPQQGPHQIAIALGSPEFSLAEC